MKKFFCFLLVFYIIFTISVIVVGNSFDVAAGVSMGEEHSCQYLKKITPVLERNSLVTIKLKEDKFSLKRIVAIEGDVVEVTKNEIKINGEVFAQITFNSTPVEKTYHLQKDEFFVLGDNYHNSYDSKYYGPIKRDQIMEENIYYKNPLDEDDFTVSYLNFIFFTLKGTTAEEYCTIENEKSLTR